MMIWLIEFPTYQYEEDVKKLAKDNGLKIVDKRFSGSIDPSLVCDNPPSLTVKGQKKRGRKPKAGADDKPESDTE